MNEYKVTWTGTYHCEMVVKAETEEEALEQWEELYDDDKGYIVDYSDNSDAEAEYLKEV